MKRNDEDEIDRALRGEEEYDGGPAVAGLMVLIVVAMLGVAVGYLLG